MSSHPLNLALRFFLALLALGSAGFRGFKAGPGWAGPVLAAGIPLGAAAVWGLFAVPGNPSRSGRATVPVPGLVRPGIECLVFGAAWALFDLGLPGIGLSMVMLVAVHYALSHGRVRWLQGSAPVR